MENLLTGNTMAADVGAATGEAAKPSAPKVSFGRERTDAEIGALPATRIAGVPEAVQTGTFAARAAEENEERLIAALERRDAEAEEAFAGTPSADVRDRLEYARLEARARLMQARPESFGDEEVGAVFRELNRRRFVANDSTLAAFDALDGEGKVTNRSRLADFLAFSDRLAAAKSPESQQILLDDKFASPELKAWRMVTGGREPSERERHEERLFEDPQWSARVAGYAREKMAARGRDWGDRARDAFTAAKRWVKDGVDGAPDEAAEATRRGMDDYGAYREYARTLADDEERAAAARLMPYLSKAQRDLVNLYAAGGEVGRGVFLLMKPDDREMMYRMIHAVRPTADLNWIAEGAARIYSGARNGVRGGLRALEGLDYGMRKWTSVALTGRDDLFGATPTQRRMIRDELLDDIRWAQATHDLKLEDPRGFLEKALGGYADSFALQGSAVGGAALKRAALYAPHPAAKGALAVSGALLQGYMAWSMVGEQFENMLMRGVDVERAAPLAVCGGLVDSWIENANVGVWLGAKGVSPADMKRVGLRAAFRASLKMDWAELAKVMRVNGGQFLKITASEVAEEMAQAMDKEGWCSVAEGREIMRSFLGSKAWAEAGNAFVEALPTCTAFGLAGAANVTGSVARGADSAYARYLDGISRGVARRRGVEELGEAGRAAAMRVARNEAQRVVNATKGMSAKDRDAWINAQTDLSLSEKDFYRAHCDFYEATRAQDGEAWANALLSGSIDEALFAKAGWKFEHDENGRINAVTTSNGKRFKVDFINRTATVDDFTDAEIAAFVAEWNRTAKEGERLTGRDDPRLAKAVAKTNGLYDAETGTVVLFGARADGGTLGHEATHGVIAGMQSLHDRETKRALKAVADAFGGRVEGGRLDVGTDEAVANRVEEKVRADILFAMENAAPERVDVKALAKNVFTALGKAVGLGKGRAFLPVIRRAEGAETNPEEYLHDIVARSLVSYAARQKIEQERRDAVAEARKRQKAEREAKRQRKIRMRAEARAAETAAPSEGAPTEGASAPAETVAPSDAETAAKDAAEVEAEIAAEEQREIDEINRKAEAERKLLEDEERKRREEDERAEAERQRKMEEKMLRNRKNAVKTMPKFHAPKGTDEAAAKRMAAAYEAAWRAKSGKFITQADVDMLAEVYGLPPEALNLKRMGGGYRLVKQQLLSDASLARFEEGLERFYDDILGVEIEVPDVVVGSVEEAANAVPNEVWDPVSETFIEGRVVVDAANAKSFREQAGLKDEAAPKESAPAPTVTPAEIMKSREGGAVEEDAAPKDGEETIVEKMTERAPVEELSIDEVHNDDTRIPNFKEGANPETGVVEPLMGEPYDLVANPIVVMEFRDGKKVVVTGRHRLDLYRRAGRRTIAARVIREADGWTVKDAQAIDAMANIIDEKGTVKDYVRFFENVKPTRADAEAGGWLARQKGRDAYGIYEGATPDTRAAIDWEATGNDGLISVAQAATISQVAPRGAEKRNAALQRVLVARALKGVTGRKLAILGRTLAEEAKRIPADAGSGGGATQLDLFASAEDQSLLKAMERQAEYRSRRANEYYKIAQVLRTAMQKGGKLELNAAYAKELGIKKRSSREDLAKARDLAVEKQLYWENAVQLEDADKAEMNRALAEEGKGGETRFSISADDSINDALENVTNESLSAALDDIIVNGRIDIRGTEGSRIAAKIAAAAFFAKYARMKIRLSTGAVLFFAPDKRTLARNGGDKSLAWAEYALHQVTNNHTDGEGRNYRSYNEGKVEVVNPLLDKIILEDKAELGANGNVLFYSQLTPDNYAKVVAKPVESGNYRADLTDVSSIYEKGKIPGKLNPLARVVGKDGLGGVFTSKSTVGSISYFGGDAQGGASLPEGTRFSISHLYTGSAADYEKPSLVHVGTGEGSQVYGWGLYASNVRGVADRYANNISRFEHNGKTMPIYIDDSTAQGLAESMLRGCSGHVDKAIIILERDQRRYQERGLSDEKIVKAIEYLRNHGNEYNFTRGVPHVYEQTFFTNRGPGDESHLLNWYEPVSDANLKRIEERWSKEHRGSLYKDRIYRTAEEERDSAISSGRNMYSHINAELKSPKATSEFLARADIDGVKYPVDSYNGGKGVKDGDKVGWNYVSFRDDNISVDHKWVNGETRFSMRGRERLVDEANAREFKRYVKNLPAAEMPKRLSDGSPRAVLAWFEENMVGKTYKFYIPGYGYREFTPTAGHIGKLVCAGGRRADGTKIVKGRIAKANGDAAHGFEMVRNGEISAEEVEGWDQRRAKSLPLVPMILTQFDAALHEKDARGGDVVIFLKKFANKKGRPNTVVMKLVNDGVTIGPLSAHIDDLTLSWLKNKDLLLTSEGEVYDGSTNNSANRKPLAGDNAEGNSPESEGSLPQTDGVAQGGIEIGGEGIVEKVKRLARPAEAPGADAPRFSIGDRSAANVAKFYLAREIMENKGRLPPAARAARVARALGYGGSVADLLSGAEAEAAKQTQLLRVLASDPKTEKALAAAGLALRNERAIERARSAAIQFSREVGEAAAATTRAAERAARAVRGEDYERMLVREGLDLDAILRAIRPAEREAGGDGEKDEEKGTPAPLTDEERALVAKAAAEAIANGADAIAKAKEAIRAKEAADAAKQKDGAKEGDEDEDGDEDSADGSEGDDGREGVVARAIRETIAKAGFTLESPEAMVQLVKAVTEKYVRDFPAEFAGVDMDDVWSSPLVRAKFSANLASFAQSVADAYAPSYARVRIASMAQALDDKGFTTLRQIEEAGEALFRDLHRDVIRQTRAGLIGEIRKLVRPHAKHYRENELTQERKGVDSALGRYCTFAYRVMRYSAKKCEERAAQLEQELAAWSGVADAEKERIREFADKKTELEMIDMFGNLRDRMPAELAELRDFVEQTINESRWEVMQYGEKWEKARSEAAQRIAAGVVGDPKRGGVKPEAEETSGLYSLIGMFETKARQLTRWATGAARDESLRAFGAVEEMIQRAEDAQFNYMQREKAKFVDLCKSVYGDHVKAGWALTAEIDRSLWDSLDRGGQKTAWTVGRVMQMYVSCVQSDYADNCAKWGRDAAYVRHLEDVLNGIDPRHMDFIEGMRAIYREQGDALDEVMRRTTGTRLLTPGRNYMPVRMFRNDNIARKARARAYSPFAPSLTPRVRNGLDFSQDVDIVDLWQERMEDAAHTVAWADTGSMVQGVLQSDSVLRAIRDGHGDKVLGQWQRYVLDILAGAEQGRVDSSNWGLAAMRFCARLASRTWLALNPASWAKQLAAVPCFALSGDGSLRSVAKSVSFVALRPFEAAKVMRDLADTRAFQARYGVAISQEMKYATSGEGQFRNWISRLMDWSMKGIMGFDKLGVYALAGVYHQKRCELETQGKGADEASELASSWLMHVVDKTAQTTRSLNTTELQRAGGAWGILLQFKSAPAQQTQFEIGAIQEALAHPEDMRRWKKAAVCVLINHVIVPTINTAIESVVACLTSLGLPDEEKRRRLVEMWIANVVSGSLGSIVFLGTVAEGVGAILGKVATGEKVGMYDIGGELGRQMPAAEMLKLWFTQAGKLGDACLEIKEGDITEGAVDFALAIGKVVPGASWFTRKFGKPAKEYFFGK